MIIIIIYYIIYYNRYLLGSDILLLLQAIDIFVSASSGHRFLTEFLEIGGVLTILEILCISQVKEVLIIIIILIRYVNKLEYFKNINIPIYKTNN